MNAIPSPCIRNCCLDEDDICMGCFRSLDEIIAWGGADTGGRHGILARAEQRKAAYGRRLNPYSGDKSL